MEISLENENMEDLVTHIKDLGLYLESNREPLKDSKLIRLRKILSAVLWRISGGWGSRPEVGNPLQSFWKEIMVA